jgi:hypothetical protein
VALILEFEGWKSEPLSLQSTGSCFSYDSTLRTHIPGGLEMRAFWTFSATLPLAAILAGCATVPTIKENTGAINRSAEAIATNTEAVGETSATLSELEPSMVRLAELQEPMEALHGPMVEVAALGPDLRRVAELDGPLSEMASRVTDLNLSMGTLMELRASMDRLMALESSMDQLAALERPMMQLAELRKPMEDTAELAAPMGELEERLDALMALADGPWILLILGVALLWGVVTFLSVWVGVVVGVRTGRPRNTAAGA